MMGYVFPHCEQASSPSAISDAPASDPQSESAGCLHVGHTKKSRAEDFIDTVALSRTHVLDELIKLGSDPGCSVGSAHGRVTPLANAPGSYPS